MNMVPCPSLPCRKPLHHKLLVCRWVCPTFDTCISTPHSSLLVPCSKCLHHVPVHVHQIYVRCESEPDFGRCLSSTCTQ
jgi:hypothetical protein